MDLASTPDLLYRSWRVEATSERQDEDDAQYIPAPISSGFTAINRQPTLLLTPRSSAKAPAQQNQARRRATGPGRRRHNPAVGRYLGLGNTSEPTHLEKYAPLPVVPESPPPEPPRKRRRVADKDKILVLTRCDADDKDGLNQGRVSESFRVMKVARKSASARTKIPASEPSQPPFACATDFRTPSSGRILNHDPQPEQSVYVAHTITSNSGEPKPGRLITQDAVNASQCEDRIGRQLFSLESHHCNTDGSAHLYFSSPQPQIGESDVDDDDFDEDVNDDDLLMLTSEMADTVFDNTNTVSSPPAQSSTVEAQKPIVRPPFPDSARDRSPIIGLSSCMLLRTCFRIGEAINQSGQASKSGKHITLELYARVLDSERTDTKQHFTFCDLFHAKPPYIKAVYDAAIWKSVQLFEYDSRRLLQQGRTCRCIGTMKRDGNAWIMNVFNIWEAMWEDIKWVQGIVNF